MGETVYYLDRKKIGARDTVTTEKVEKQNYSSALENVLEEYFGIQFINWETASQSLKETIDKASCSGSIP